MYTTCMANSIYGFKHDKILSTLSIETKTFPGRDCDHLVGMHAQHCIFSICVVLFNIHVVNRNIGKMQYNWRKCKILDYIMGLYIADFPSTWWRHQLETFSVLLVICAGNSPVTGEIPEERPVTRIFDVFFILRLNKRLSKQTWGLWPETSSRPLWRHCNEKVRVLSTSYGVILEFLSIKKID